MFIKYLESQTSVAYINREKQRRENIMKYLARTKEIPFLSGPYILINECKLSYVAVML